MSYLSTSVDDKFMIFPFVVSVSALLFNFRVYKKWYFGQLENTSKKQSLQNKLRSVQLFDVIACNIPNNIIYYSTFPSLMILMWWCSIL